MRCEIISMSFGGMGPHYRRRLVAKPSLDGLPWVLFSRKVNAHPGIISLSPLPLADICDWPSTWGMWPWSTDTSFSKRNIFSWKSHTRDPWLKTLVQDIFNPGWFESANLGSRGKPVTLDHQNSQIHGFIYCKRSFLCSAFATHINIMHMKLLKEEWDSIYHAPIPRQISLKHLMKRWNATPSLGSQD